MRKTLYVLSAMIIIVLIAGFAFISSQEPLRWRAQIMVSFMTGQISDISLGELIPMLRPGSGYWLKDMATSNNPYNAIENPYTAATDIQFGQTLFESNCVGCHGSGGIGGSGPNLLDPLALTKATSDWATFRTIQLGVQNTAMPSYETLGHLELWQIVTYVQQLQQNSLDTEPGLSMGHVEPVTHERLVTAQDESSNWLSYSGDYNSQRFSQLKEITTENGADLEIKWIHQFSGHESIVETSPIVDGRYMYVTEPPNIVHALNVDTGETAWTYRHKLPADLRLCCGQVNRGVAIHGNKIYLGTLDAKLVALDGETGAVLWSQILADYQAGYSITGAPLVVNGMIIVGPGGGDLGIRGFIDAYHAETGGLIWRRHTIPGPGEPGHDTWSGESWRRGGGGAWLTGSYDPKLDLLYWPVGNPSPNYQGELRAGDNLYTDSILALNPASGKIMWHFQFTPHDEHDWASNQIPILLNTNWQGQNRELLVTANRNGFFYVLDRATGEFLLGEAFAKQNWARGLDESGRPVLNEATLLNTTGVVTYPGPSGATNWQSPSYSPDTQLVYVPVLEWGQIVFKNPSPQKYRSGRPYIGGGQRSIPGDSKIKTLLRAIDPTTGKIIWEHAYKQRDTWYKLSGYVSTAGGVVFGGDLTSIALFNASTGELIKTIQVGGRINASPIVYATPDGDQRFAIAAGRSIITFGLPD